MMEQNYINYDMDAQKGDDAMWLVKWNNFLTCLKKTIKDDEPIVALYEKEDLEGDQL